MTPQRIIAITASHFNVSERSVTTNNGKQGKRYSNVRDARYIAMYLCRTKVTREVCPQYDCDTGIRPMTLVAIAKMFRRDHSTIIHGIGEIEKNPHLRGVAEMIYVNNLRGR